jgi:hypothetical protein
LAESNQPLAVKRKIREPENVGGGRTNMHLDLAEIKRAPSCGALVLSS